MKLQAIRDTRAPAAPRRARLLCRAAAFVLACAGAVPAAAEDWAPNLTTSAVWHSNASNANREADQIDSLQLKADILSSQRYGLTRRDSAFLTGHLAGEWWPRYEALLSGAIGARAEWQHKFGLGALAPVLSAEIWGDYVAARETGRRGTSRGLTVYLRKRFTDAMRVTLWHEVARHDAKYAAYDRQGNESSLELDYDLGSVTRLTFTARYRNGDVTAHATPPRPDLVELASARLDVDTFGRPMVAYAIDAHTWTARGALTRALDEHSAVVAAYEWRTTERKSLSYDNHLVSVALVHQF